MALAGSTTPSGGARRVARNSVVLAAGEAGGRVAMLALYAFMARAVAQADFGDFTSAASLAVLVTMAAFGMDYTITRLVARGEAEAGEAFWSSLVLKLAFGGLAVAGIAAVAAVGAYHPQVLQATLLIGFAVVVDLVTQSVQAVFRGIEDGHPVAVGLLVQRWVLAILGIGLLAGGQSVVAVAAGWLIASAAALGYSAWRLRTAGVALPRRIGVPGMRRILVDSLGLGLSAVFGGALSRLDIVLLGLLKASTAVALYGAAYRLFESTLFLTTAFVLASFPAMSRLGRDTSPTIGTALGQATKAVVLLTAPIAMTFALFAEPLVTTVYGNGFHGAAAPLRLLAPAIVLTSIFSVLCFTLAAQRRQWSIAGAMIAATAVNVGLNLLLVPGLAERGAALAMTLSLLLGDAALLVAAVRAAGRIPTVRVAAGPLAASAGMAVVALLLGTHDLASALPALLTYVAVLLIVERRLHPRDVDLLLLVLRRRPVTA
jgi:O-antigen/teichoic acid export membrane protein